MGRNGGVDHRQLLDFKERIEEFEKNGAEEFMQECAKAIAARLLARVIKRTPVGDYPAGSGKVGGTLQRGWTVNGDSADGSREATFEAMWGANQRVSKSNIKVTRTGNTYVVEVSNPVEYASYVEYGHRQDVGRYVPAIGKKLKTSWVKGKFMLTISVKEVERMTPAVLERMVLKKMREIFNDQ